MTELRPLKDLLKALKESQFSQVPIFLGLETTNRFLAVRFSEVLRQEDSLVASEKRNVIHKRLEIEPKLP